MQKTFVTRERRRWPHQRPLPHVHVEVDLLVANALVATNTPPTDQTTTWRPERPDLDGQLCLWVREPSLLANLRTCPGGDCHRGLMDPRIKQLWSTIVDGTNPNFTLTLNKTLAARDLGVARGTVTNWVDFFVARGWVKILNKGGGRGVEIEVVWLKKGAELAAKKASREAGIHRAAQQRLCPSGANITPDVDSKPSHVDDATPASTGQRNLVLHRFRELLREAGINPTAKEPIMATIARWLDQQRFSWGQLREIYVKVQRNLDKLITDATVAGRRAVSWLCRLVGRVVPWPQRRARLREDRRLFAEIDTADRAAQAAAVDTPAWVIEAQRCEARVALAADGWL